MWFLLQALICFSVCNVICPLSNSTQGDHHSTGSTKAGDGLEIRNAENTPPSTQTSLDLISDVSHHVPRRAPCFVDDIFAALREGVGDDGELTNRSLSLFGICTVSGNSSGSILLELSKETSRNQGNGLEVLHPAGGNSAL